MPHSLLGKPAPDFTAPSNGDKTITLSDYKGKNVILYFYPKDMTPGCTTQACDFTAQHPDFSDCDCVVLGVSKDSPQKHDAFIKKHNISFDLVSDDDEGTICKSFNVWQPKKFMGKEFLGIVRSTFLINKDGIITHAWSPVKVKNHTEDVLNTLKSIL